MVDIDMTFNYGLLENILRNTAPNQVYLPIVFSQFKTRGDYTNNFLVNEKQGFWRDFGFGMLSIYQKDFMRSGGYDLSINGWGLEDVRLCDQFIKALILDSKYETFISLY
jgi:chondroitin sulfate synthase